VESNLSGDMVLVTSSYDDWGLEITKLAIRTQPQQLINLHIVAEFPSTAKICCLMKSHSFIGDVVARSPILFG